MVEQAKPFFVQFAAHAHQIFFFAAAVFADKLLGDAAVLRQHQQSDGIDVQPTGWRQAEFVFFAERNAAVVPFPTVVGGNQLGGGFVAFFRLRADVADGLVEQDGDALRLFFMRLPVEVDAVALGHFLTEYGGLPVDLDPALLDVTVRLAARA